MEREKCSVNTLLPEVVDSIINPYLHTLAVIRLHSPVQ